MTPQRPFHAPEVVTPTRRTASPGQPSHQAPWITMTPQRPFHTPEEAAMWLDTEISEAQHNKKPAPRKFYVVFKGLEPGVYTNWYVVFFIAL